METVLDDEPPSKVDDKSATAEAKIQMKGVGAMKINDIRVSTIGGTICSIWMSFSIDYIAQIVLTAALGTFSQFYG